MCTVLAKRSFGTLSVFRGRPVGRVQHATIPPAGVQGYGRTRRIIENNQTIPGQTDKRVFRRKQHYRNEREREIGYLLI